MQLTLAMERPRQPDDPDCDSEGRYLPCPERVRKRLTRILAELARTPEVAPDDFTARCRLKLFKTIVPQMARVLPETEAAANIDAIGREIERLEGNGNIR